MLPFWHPRPTEPWPQSHHTSSRTWPTDHFPYSLSRLLTIARESEGAHFNRALLDLFIHQLSKYLLSINYGQDCANLWGHVAKQRLCAPGAFRQVQYLQYNLLIRSVTVNPSPVTTEVQRSSPWVSLGRGGSEGLLEEMTFEMTLERWEEVSHMKGARASWPSGLRTAQHYFKFSVGFFQFCPPANSSSKSLAHSSSCSQPPHLPPRAPSPWLLG